MLTTLWLGVLNNDAHLRSPANSEDGKTYRIVGDPTEGALIVAAAKAGALHEDLNEAYPRENEVPFDSERKRMITIHDVGDPQAGGYLAFYDDTKYKDWDVIAVKGAPDVVLDLCTHYQTMDDKPRRWMRPPASASWMPTMP